MDKQNIVVTFNAPPEEKALFPNQLNEQLIAIVQETMQPTQVSLWLRSGSHNEMHNTQV